MLLLSRILIAILITPLPALAQLPTGIEDSGLYLAAASGGFAPATTLNTEFEIDVTGIVAEVTIRQRFRNAGSDWVEGIYVFPLPEDAAVDELVMRIGNRRIEGEIQEREQARQTYERARAAGQQASLVEQERPNLFTTSVANIAPGQEIVVEIGFMQTASYDDGEFELRLPMTLTPRFVTGNVVDSARIRPPVRRTGSTDTHRAAIRVDLDAGLPLEFATSTSHSLDTSDNGRRVRLMTRENPVPMDRDLVINWRVVPDQSPRVAAFTENRGGDDYLLLMFVPPTTTVIPQTSPRELIFVIDTSGSMGGNSIARARTALQTALARLEAGDRFNVIEFNSNARTLFPAPVAVMPETIDSARRFVSRLRANGGTNIAAALTAAFGQPTMHEALRQIVFVTDGSVGNESELFQMVRQDLGDARLFTVGIGSAPNEHFMRKAAQFGRGSYLYIEGAADVGDSMERLFAKLENVALTDIEIDWPAGFEVYPARVPDLYRGEPVIVAARAPGRIRRSVTLPATGYADVYGWADQIALSGNDASGVATLWAGRKIQSLLDGRLEGETETAVRTAVLEVALEHGLLSPYTSLVAVDTTPERTRDALLQRQALGNLPPAGSTTGSRFARLPGTATNANVYQLIGLLLTALLIGVIGLARSGHRAHR